MVVSEVLVAVEVEIRLVEVKQEVQEAVAH